MDEPLRLAAAGCGRVFERYHAPALRHGSGWTLVAGCDPDAERRAAFRALAPGSPAYETVEELLAGTAVDAVLITAPPALHASLAHSAVAQGKHVLAEKPLALTVADGERMVAAARAAGVQLWVGCQRRFGPAADQLAGWLAGRMPHDVRAITFESRSSPEGWDAYSGFLGKETEGGDALLDHATHQLDLLTWLVGSYPSTVRAKRHDDEVRYTVRWATGVEAACTVGHGLVNEDRLTIQLTDCTLVRRGPWAARFRRLPARWQGSALRLRSARSTALELLTRRVGPETAEFAAQLAAFGRAVREGGGPARGADGVAALAAIEACRASLAAKGAWQPLAAIADDG
jgi:predicted dehydrogenase